MESYSKSMKSSKHELPPRPVMTVTFSRDTLERKVEASKPLQAARKPGPKFGNVGKIGEKDADPVLVSVVNYHSKLLEASGRSFDLVVGKLCHLLKTNGYYLDSTYKETVDALFYSIRTMILDQEKSELSRTRLLECLELRAKTWGHDPLELPPAHPQGLSSPLKPPEVAYPQEQVVIQSQRPPSQGSGRYSPIPLPPLQVDPPSPDMVAMTHVAKSVPLADDTDDDEDDDQWLTTSDMTYESDSSEDFIMPEHEVQDLMMESTTELDDELSRLLSAKLPDSYKRRVNDGKPVRYTRSFLLDLWKSPFSKEMPSVLRHTICHSDVGYIIQRHAFSDPGVLFKQGSREDILLMSSHLRSDPNLRIRRSSGRNNQDPAGTVGDKMRQRTLSWPQGAGAKSPLDVEGRGEDGLVQGTEGARYSRTEERVGSTHSPTWQGDIQGGGQEATLRPQSPADWRRPGSSVGMLGDGAARSTGQQTLAAGGEEVSLRPHSPNDWRRPGSSAGILGDPLGGSQQGGQDESLRPRSPNDWRRPGSAAGILGSGGATVTGARISTPSPIVGGGDRAKQPERPGSSRGRSPSASSQEGAMKVRFDLPMDKKEGESQTDQSPWISGSASSRVLLTPRQILGEGISDQSISKPPVVRSPPPSDVNNNGYHPVAKAEGAFDMMSSVPAQQPEVLTFREVFKEVIEKGITTGAPGPAADLQAVGQTAHPRATSSKVFVPLSSTYKGAGDSRSGQAHGHMGGSVEQTNLPKPPTKAGNYAGWTPKDDWN